MAHEAWQDSERLQFNEALESSSYYRRKRLLPFVRHLYGGSQTGPWRWLLRSSVRQLWCLDGHACSAVVRDQQ